MTMKEIISCNAVKSKDLDIVTNSQNAISTITFKQSHIVKNTYNDEEIKTHKNI